MLMTNADGHARTLLNIVRRTPMRRGSIPGPARAIRPQIEASIIGTGVPAPLARRIALQLAMKCDVRDLQDELVWRGIGFELHDEITCLREFLEMPDRHIVALLPKMSARRILEFHDELMKSDRRIARTILNAAADAADPLAKGRRYLAEYRLVTTRVREINPRKARTLANATFTSGVPLTKAMRLVRAAPTARRY